MTSPSASLSKMETAPLYAPRVIAQKRYITTYAWHPDVQLRRPLEIVLRHIVSYGPERLSYWQARCYVLREVVNYGETEDEAMRTFFDALLRVYREIQFAYSLPHVTLAQAEALDRRLSALYRQIIFAPRVFDFLSEENS